MNNQNQLQQFHSDEFGTLEILTIDGKPYFPAAVRFERWIFDEVLPSIRKFGAYVAHDTLDEMLRNPAFTDALIRKLSKERERNAVLAELATEMAPKALYCDLILQSKDTVPVSLIAKDYGMTAATFNSLLHNLRVQFKVGGTWLLYQNYAEKGYVKTQTYYISRHTSAMHTCWTQKGRLFLYELLKENGMIPMMEKAA
ncbi:hypothetical protein FACS18949_15170 [Clostridia bacterium]|nr:hypothetical protein FACS18949_15170 [Clostridia bacterium]